MANVRLFDGCFATAAMTGAGAMTGDCRSRRPVSAKPTKGMKLYQRRRITTFHRALNHIEENPLTQPLALATSLIAELTATSTALDGYGGSQDHGFGTVRGAVAVRRLLREELYSTLRELAQAAVTMEDHPGLAGEMRLGRNNSSYASLLARARGFHAALVPSKSAFVALGFDATIDADLLTQIHALEEAAERKNSGRAAHIGSTAGLEALCKRGLHILQKLDVIFSKAYKNDPVKLATWKAARRVERSSRSTASAPVPVIPPAPEPEPSGS